MIRDYAAGFLLSAACLWAADRPQWGEAWSRNMVSAEQGLPADFDLAAGRNILWRARLGTEAHSTPVIARGRVYIGTNNGQPRDPQHEGDRGVLMCFDERDGSFLWQLVVPKLEEDRYFDWPNSGISSPATVDGDRVYIVSNRGEVLCLDPSGLADGNAGPFTRESEHMRRPGGPVVTAGPKDADIVWLFDMVSGAGIWNHDGAHSSILVDGDFLYLNTGTGVDNTHRKIRTPDAPSLIVLDKRTGRLLAREREGIAPNIFHCTWSSPSLGMVGGRKAVFFAAGNGMIYAFEPLAQAPPPGEVATLKKFWQFDFDPKGPKTGVHRFNTNRREGPSNIQGLPVFHAGRIFVAGGGDLWWGKNEAWLKCLDAERGAEVWSYPIPPHVMSTPAVAEGLVFIADCGRRLHCVDAATGQPSWTHEMEGLEIWASPLVADGKVYLGTRKGDFAVFAASKEKRVLFQTKFSAPISSTVAAANGTLYVATMTELFAIRQSAKPASTR